MLKLDIFTVERSGIDGSKVIGNYFNDANIILVMKYRTVVNSEDATGYTAYTCFNESIFINTNDSSGKLSQQDYEILLRQIIRYPGSVIGNY